MNINDGGPAFPTQPIRFQNDAGMDCVATGCDGMTLRDWFAGKEQLVDYGEFTMGMCEALAGKRPDGNRATNGIAWLEWEATCMARIRYIRADAMLKAREAKP